MYKRSLLILIFLSYYLNGIQAQDRVPDLSCIGIENALLRELWSNVEGSTIGELTNDSRYPALPTTQRQAIRIEEFAGNNLDLDNYGQRFRGFIKAPESGEYQFNITGDDQVDVFLGTNEASGSRVKIAAVNSRTDRNQHDRYEGQTSRRIPLVKGQYYYLEILHKQRNGDDHLTLYWKTPITINSSEWVVIPNVHFRSYSNACISRCTVDVDNDGVCASDDCNDNDPKVGRRRTPGTSCDDGNENTINDIVIGIGCDCIGVPRPIGTTNVPACGGIQSFLHFEIWNGIEGTTIADLKRHVDYPDSPTRSNSGIGRFRVGSDPSRVNNYGQRIRGFIQAPETGEYQFNITGADQIEVYLGTNDEPSSQVLIAEVTGRTDRNQHSRYLEQTSDQIRLERGVYYYLEVFHKAGEGENDVGLFWKTPATIGSNQWVEIPSNYFLNYSCATTIACTNNDNDNVCAKDDCDDRDPNVGRRRTPGTACNDNNPNTTNDVVTAGGCGCAGTPIITSPSVTSCVGTQNALLRELWRNVGGATVDKLVTSSDYPDNPTESEIISGRSIPSHIGDYYGQRIRGFIRAPQSGAYQFNITGDDDIDVFLSTNEAPSSRVKIAEVNGWTNPNQHNRYPEQTSDRITLVAGQYYYLEILHKEGAGGDYVDLYWKTPNTIGSSEWVSVPGDRLWSYDCGSTPITPCSVDADNDGFCAENDCNDNNANLPATPGTSCNDGNDNTINDQILADGCNCAGTPRPIDPSSVSSCVGTQNALYREVWEGVGGSTIADLKEHIDYPSRPTEFGIIVGGVIPSQIKNYYGQRIRGFIQAPQTGEYQFNIVGDDDVDVFFRNK